MPDRTASCQRGFFFKVLGIAGISSRAGGSKSFSLAPLKTLVTLAAVFPLLTSCAGTLTADEQYERDDALIVAGERFEQRRRQCRATGGDMRMLVKFPSRIKRKYTTHDYKTAMCQRL